ncbi:hypothetical protein L218DRAFT_966541 [Marasmius fiardii PR-910]|nr:hypothetical protein L218DRAFT_966541 [Marasmius fiardii PR-910]
MRRPSRIVSITTQQREIGRLRGTLEEAHWNICDIQLTASISAGFPSLRCLLSSAVNLSKRHSESNERRTNIPM